MIAIVDYGAGNLFSVKKALKALDLDAEVISQATSLDSISHLILPGVGSFGAAVEALKQRGLWETLQEWWRLERPFLGICLGMQLMTQSSEESPGVAGLAWLQAETVALRRGKVPNMGWCELGGVAEEAAGRLGLADGQCYYFVHSFAVKTEEAAARAWHETEFCAVLGEGLRWGVQFHPEKSGQQGLGLLRNWRDKCR